MTASVPAAPTAETPARVGRGLLFSLGALPVGIVIFTIVYGLGYFAAVVFALVAGLTVWLYRKGAGHLTGAGYAVIAGVIIVTFLASFAVGVVWTVALALSEITGLQAFEVVGQPGFLETVQAVVTDPSASGDIAGDFGLGALFTLLGAGAVIFSTVRQEREQKKAAQAGAAAATWSVDAPATPAAPTVAPTTEAGPEGTAKA